MRDFICIILWVLVIMFFTFIGSIWLLRDNLYVLSDFNDSNQVINLKKIKILENERFNKLLQELDKQK